MLKLRKIFSLGLTVAAVAALGLMVASCVEPVDYYSVEMKSGTYDEYGDTLLGQARPGSSGARSNYEEGAVVEIKAGTPPTGKVFYQWTSAQVVFADPLKSNTSFTMPAEDVIVVAWFIDAPVSAPQVRYTWETVEQPKIQSIAASFEDVKFWYETVYMAEDYVEDDATDIPINDGSVDIPNNIYSKTLGSTQYKGKYLPISEGDYTAVCTGSDVFGDFDIVANYEIAVSGDSTYFEIAFDVGTFTDADAGGDPETAWFPDKFNKSTDPPRLVKAPVTEKPKVKKLTKKLENGGSVTYYFLRRASK